MSRYVGTVVRGIRTKIIKTGDPLDKIVVESVLDAVSSDNFSLNDRDIIGVTEAIVARSQGNYVTVDHIAKDVQNKFPSKKIGIVFPILSRNRFATCLKGIARGAEEIILLLGLPSDEVGNHLLPMEKLDEKKINPYTTTLTEEEFTNLFGNSSHPFTNVDYVKEYKNIIQNEGAKVKVIFSNDPFEILKYTKDVLVCNTHGRFRIQNLLKNNDNNVLTLQDIMNAPIDDSGYNEEFGLLGSNISTDNSVKLFPRNSFEFAKQLQDEFKKATGKNIEVLVYGDGAFKDSVGQIWELADPVVSPGYTDGLIGVPNELKLKFLADATFKDLKGEELNKAILEAIKNKDKNQAMDEKNRLGTTPRKLTDLIGSLCDLTSGSGDKGTPIILIQGYFDNYANE